MNTSILLVESQVILNRILDFEPGGGATRMSRGYQAHPKIHIIRVVFQYQALYARTSFRGAKTCKIGKKGVFMVIIDKLWKGHDGQIKKNACKNAYLGFIFIPEKYVIRVLLVCPWTSLIPPLAIRVAPRVLSLKISSSAHSKQKQARRSAHYAFGMRVYQISKALPQTGNTVP